MPCLEFTLSHATHRMSIKLGVVVTQRSVLCITSADESKDTTRPFEQCRWIFVDLSSSIECACRHILERAHLMFDEKLDSIISGLQMFRRRWPHWAEVLSEFSFSARVYNKVDESKYIHASWRNFSDIEALSKVVGVFVESTFTRVFSDYFATTNYPSAVEPYMQDYAQMVNVLFESKPKTLQHYLHERYYGTTAPRDVVYVTVLLTTEKKHENKCNRLRKLWQDDDEFRKATYYPALRNLGRRVGDRTIAMFLPLGEHTCKNDNDVRDVEMKRIIDQNDANKIEFVVIPWRYDASVFARMKSSDFGERFRGDDVLDSTKEVEIVDVEGDAEREHDNRVAEFSSVAARVLRWCNITRKFALAHEGSNYTAFFDCPSLQKCLFTRMHLLVAVVDRHRSNVSTWSALQEKMVCQSMLDFQYYGPECGTLPVCCVLFTSDSAKEIGDKLGTVIGQCDDFRAAENLVYVDCSVHYLDHVFRDEWCHPEIITNLVQYDDKNKWMSLMDYCVLAEEHSKKYIANRKLYRRTFTSASDATWRFLWLNIEIDSEYDQKSAVTNGEFCNLVHWYIKGGGVFSNTSWAEYAEEFVERKHQKYLTEKAEAEQRKKDIDRAELLLEEQRRRELDYETRKARRDKKLAKKRG